MINKMSKKTIAMPYWEYLNIEKALKKKKRPFCYIMLTKMELPGEPEYKQFDMGSEEELEGVIRNIIDQENFVIIYKDYYDRLRESAYKFDKFKDMTVWGRLKICFEHPIYFI